MAMSFGVRNADAMAPAELRCERYEDPLGVDSPRPQLSWILQSQERGVIQSAYQVIAASSIDLLARDTGDLWDSGRVYSGENTQVAYAGHSLQSGQEIFWKARIWDQTGKPSGWSAAAEWTMGLLTEADWDGAAWIGAAVGGSQTRQQAVPGGAVNADGPNGTTEMRREFAVKPGLKRAVLFACGLGQQEIDLDGVKVGNDLFEPGYTDYRKTCFYDTYDITRQLNRGQSHRLKMLLGNGFYNLQPAPGRYTKFTNSFGPRKGIAMLRLEYNNGEIDHIVTDGNWKTAAGSTTFANMYAGEDYDARLDQVEAAWAPAAILTAPGGKLIPGSEAAPPVRASEIFKPIRIKEIKLGVSVYDFGQNATMIPILRAWGPPGSTIRMIPAEVLYPDGTVNRRTCTQDKVRPAWWQYTLCGHGTEMFVPKFFWHGARYLQVELLPGAPGGQLPVAESIDSCAVHSSALAVGSFSCSNELFNQIYSLVRWAQQNNMGSVLTDCPHRERLGWLEEDHLNGPALRYDFDMEALFNKIMGDMSDDQTPVGLIPNFVPEYTRLSGAFRDSTEWGSALIMVAWQQYQFYGDKQVLVRYYEQMKHYLEYLSTKARDGTMAGGLGDWFDIGPKPPWTPQLTPVSNTDTCFYFQDAQVMSRIAAILGKDEDASKFETLADSIRASFNQKFFNWNTGQYSTGSQASNAIPFVMNIVEPENRESVFQGIVKDLENHGNSFTTGEVAYRYLLRALADEGRSDLVFSINNQSDKPGYGMQVKEGCTSLTERWDGGTTGWSSQDHFMSGQIVEWLYHDLAGIQPDKDAPGFKKIIIRPAIVGNLTWVKAAYDSINGRIVSEWRRKGHAVSLHVIIPPNTGAVVAVPGIDASAVTEGGRPAIQSVGVRFLRQDGAYLLYQVGSGDYMFRSVLEAVTLPNSHQSEGEKPKS